MSLSSLRNKPCTTEIYLATRQFEARAPADVAHAAAQEKPHMNVGPVRAVYVEEAAHRHQLRPRQVVQEELVAEILGDLVDLPKTSFRNQARLRFPCGHGREHARDTGGFGFQVDAAACERRPKRKRGRVQTRLGSVKSGTLRRRRVIKMIRR